MLVGVQDIKSLQDWYDKIIHGDAFEVMPQIPNGIADTVFWDPPYYLQISGKNKLKRWKAGTDVHGVNDDWDKFSSFEEYDLFISKALENIKRIMKSNGTIWVIGTYHNIHRIGKIMQDMGFWILNDVIWLKTNPMPNWLGVRFTNAIETIIWAVKDKEVKKYYFDKSKAVEYTKHVTAPCVFQLPICTGSERIKDDNGIKVHSTQKPEALLERIISVSTPVNGLVFDPMAGTGTTAAVAKKINRHFLVVEKDEKYIQVIKHRLEQLNRTIL